jgi:hypothetical protein
LARCHIGMSQSYSRHDTYQLISMCVPLLAELYMNPVFKSELLDESNSFLAFDHHKHGLSSWTKPFEVTNSQNKQDFLTEIRSLFLKLDDTLDLIPIEQRDAYLNYELCLLLSSWISKDKVANTKILIAFAECAMIKTLHKINSFYQSKFPELEPPLKTRNLYDLFYHNGASVVDRRFRRGDLRSIQNKLDYLRELQIAFMAKKVIAQLRSLGDHISLEDYVICIGLKDGSSSLARYLQDFIQT